ncbi:hypothetical protein [Halocatena halophila]|uniref:hypothetical protein n=1 Tax=Halocatena halophila TaxID=2814576 RepID=UPI002ED52A28
MPHPDSLVDITVDADIGAAPRDQFSTVALIGSAATEPPDGFNNATRHLDAESVASGFGDGTAIHNQAKEVFAEGVGALWAIVLEETETTEVIADSDTNSVSSGIVSTFPISGASPVAITVDGDAADPVTATTESPPPSPPTDEAAYNPDTGEIEVGTSSSGGGSGGIEVTYTTLSWTAALDELSGISPDLVALTQRAGEESIGDYDELLTWADGEAAAVPVVYPNGSDYSDPITGMDEAHEVGSYLTSKFGLPIASESSDNVAGRVVGRYAVEEAWYNIFLKTLPLSVPTPTRYDRYVGSPELQGTFEGGTAADGAGASNVLLSDGGTILSNSLSLAGLQSDYRYLDIARLEAFVTERIRVAVGNLFRDNDIRYNASGRTSIQAAIEEELNPITGNRNQPLRDFSITVPAPEDIPSADRSNRLWTGIMVEITISGYAHRADVTLVIEV